MKSRVWEEISYNNLKHNLETIKGYAKEKTLICIVKDNAYGMGAVKIAKFLESDERVVAFAVATLDEAIELKRNNITKDIIIIGHIDTDAFVIAVENNIIVTISSFDKAYMLNQVAKKLGKVARIEIAIDTGMGRIGFEVNDNSLKYIKDIYNLSNINIYGMFSHFSVADCDFDDSENANYTKEQEKKLLLLVNKLKENGIEISNTSISASAGLIKGNGANFSSVRPGIILYGIVPSKAFTDIDIKPIMSLKSRIVHIKDISENASISYGRTFVSKNNMTVATISCGYGDGYPRTASNKAYVIINDKKCKVIGRVTMDMFMVDVTGVKCEVGDEVILIGESEHEKITLDELCSITNEFTYEILTRINWRVERIYID